MNRIDPLERAHEAVEPCQSVARAALLASDEAQPGSVASPDNLTGTGVGTGS